MANFGGQNGPRTYMDVETGDITVVNDNGCGGGTIFHIPGKAKK